MLERGLSLFMFTLHPNYSKNYFDEAIIPQATISLKYFEKILKKTDYSYPSLFTSATNTAWPNLDPNWGPYNVCFFRIFRDTSKPNNKTNPLPISSSGNSSNFSPGIPGAPATNVWLQSFRMCPIATDHPARQAGSQRRSVGVLQSCKHDTPSFTVSRTYVRTWSYAYSGRCAWSNTEKSWVEKLSQ